MNGLTVVRRSNDDKQGLYFGKLSTEEALNRRTIATAQVFSIYQRNFYSATTLKNIRQTRIAYFKYNATLQTKNVQVSSPTYNTYGSTTSSCTLLHPGATLVVFTGCFVVASRRVQNSIHILLLARLYGHKGVKLSTIVYRECALVIVEI